MTLKFDNNSLEEVFLAFRELYEDKKDISKISMSDISEKSGIHIGTLYGMFTDKFDLALSMLEQKIQDVFVTFDEDTDESIPLGDKLKSFISLQLEFVGPYLKLIRELMSHPISTSSVMLRAKNRYVGFLSELFSEYFKDKSNLLKEIAIFGLSNSFLAFNLTVIQYWEFDKSEGKKNTLSFIENGVKNFMVVSSLI